MINYRNRLAVPAALTAAFVVAACSGLTVNSDFDPSANFSAFQSYEWLPDSQSESAQMAQDPLVDRRIRAAIDNDLQSKGFRRMDDGSGRTGDVRICRWRCGVYRREWPTRSHAAYRLG